METKEIIEFKNPFRGNNLKIVKCVSENRLTRDTVATMLETLEVEDENEFYVLFNTGVLIKKERSKFRTSDYFKGGKMIKIKEVYNG